MRRLIVILSLSLWMFVLQAQKGMDYFLPANLTYDPAIPTPEAFLGYPLGEWHVTHDRLVEYMHTIASLSDRVKLEVIGKTYENRPLLHLYITSPENQANLDQLLKEHQQLADPEKSQNSVIEKMPAVVLLGYTVHGNEASGANSSLLTAYYLSAARGPAIEKLLQNTIVIVDPCLNPDGYTRFSTWVNLHKNQTPNPDPNGREFNEYWPGGRTNHYWFDLNRDYLFLVNPESQSRIKELQKWLPNVVTDHHEMGSDATFFFQPGIPSRNNPLTPQKNYELTHRIAAYHAKALNKIHSLYYSEESYDDFYVGKGSSYPDINSGIGILFEQASVRGAIRETSNGIIDFPFAIRNQFTATLSTLEAVQALKNDLLQYQRDFYITGQKESSNDPVKAYIFGDNNDRARTYEFARILDQQHIKMFHLKKDITRNNQYFSKETAFIVPMQQQNYRLIKTLFEPVKQFADSSFYDVSTWDLPMSFNLPMVRVKDKKEMPDLLGESIGEPAWTNGVVKGTEKPYAWVFRWDGYYAPRALYTIMSKGILVKVSQGTFQYKDNLLNETFGYGTIMIPTQNQQVSVDNIEKLLQEIAKRDGINIYRLQTGLTARGIDLGSRKFSTLKKPKIALVAGNGMRSSDVGEIWHLFDTRYNVPVTLLDAGRLERVRLDKYNVLILPGGSFGSGDAPVTQKIKSWVRNGGTLIAYKSAVRWASGSGLASINFKKQAPPDKSCHNYANRYKNISIQMISGAIFNTTLDITNPVAYGFNHKELPVFKTGTMVAENPRNSLETPVVHTQRSLLSGYTSPENQKRIDGSPFLFVQNFGSGQVISILDNTNFRGVWFGTNKIFANSVFFGQLF